MIWLQVASTMYQGDYHDRLGGKRGGKGKTGSNIPLTHWGCIM